MTQVLVVAALIGLGLIIALVLRPKVDAPSVPSYKAPAQLDPADFAGLVRGSIVAFLSQKCDSCADVELLLDSVDNAQIMTAEIDEKIFSKYSIDGVPTTLIVDEHGVVGRCLFGPVTQSQLQAAIAESLD